LYRWLAQTFARQAIGFVALKGLTQCPLFGSQPEDRPQYDVDLFIPRETIGPARDLLLASGYHSLEGVEHLPTDHLPALVRKTGWEFRGDFFDPEAPLPIEIHFRFWNGVRECLPAPGVEDFWQRRTVARVPTAELDLPRLSAPDALGFASLHYLKHILRGSGRPFHAYEIACFLDSHAGDDAFWAEWRALHSPELRRLQAVVFGFVAEWFGCRTGEAQEEIEQLPASTQAWFEEFALSPARRLFESCKDELWLHLSLLGSRRDAWRVARRRLLPGNRPGPVDAAHLAGEISWRRRALGRVRYAAHVASRLRHHAVALPATALSGVRWWWRTNRLGRQFWVFLAAAVLLNLGLFIFSLLYNLYLLDLGFHEDSLGLVATASTMGSAAGILPAALVARRFGLRNTVLGTLAAAATVMALRALASTRLPLVALAFLFGSVFSVWAVVMAPAVAAAVEEKRRPRAFSVFFAAMFSLGIVGYWAGGQLPRLVHSKRIALLVAAAIVTLALIPASRLKRGPLRAKVGQTLSSVNPPAAPEGQRIYPRGPFLRRYLASLAVWSAAVGAFNPFANAYFARLGYSAGQIGAIFSRAQAPQAAIVLLAPWVFRKAGLVTGIALMMLAAAAALGGLAAQPSGLAPLVFIAYMSFQWMSEPGMNTLLMNHVAERERGGASSLNMLVFFSAQALASFVSGRCLDRFGYGVVLAAATGLAVVAAGLFRFLLRPMGE
jgi:MFS family permease